MAPDAKPRIKWCTARTCALARPCDRLALRPLGELEDLTGQDREAAPLSKSRTRSSAYPDTVTDLSRALTVALEAAGAARELLLAECARPDGPRGEIGHCPADDEAEWIIRERLLAAFPTWGFLGEETGEQAAADGEPGDAHIWVVDPNDGTTSMQRGYRGHAVSIALIHAGAPVLGVVWAVDAPDDAGDLLAWAEGCGPLLRNGVPVDRIGQGRGLRPTTSCVFRKAPIAIPWAISRAPRRRGLWACPALPIGWHWWPRAIAWRPCP